MMWKEVVYNVVEDAKLIQKGFSINLRAAFFNILKEDSLVEI